MKKKLLISLQIIKYAPLILFKYFKYLLLKKSLHITEFRSSSNYSIEGALNQLIWSVDNCLFVILENTSKVYLGSSDLIFKVTVGNTRFSLKCYGYNVVAQTTTNIQVVALKQKSIDSKILKSNFLTVKKDNSRFVHSENIIRRLQRINRFTSTKLQSIKTSEEISNIQIIGYNQTLKELNDVNNYKTINQLNSHCYE